MLYELWSCRGELSFFPADHPQRALLTEGLPVVDQHTKPWTPFEELPRIPFTKIWEVKADSWEEAMTKLHERMGWEPYVPMDDDLEGEGDEPPDFHSGD